MILLVEDEAITRNALADTLRREGHEVIEAADGNKAGFPQNPVWHGAGLEKAPLILEPMQLRDFPLMSHRGTPNWPPTWNKTTGGSRAGPYEILRGEIGTLQQVLLSKIEPNNRCYLLIEFRRMTYVGALVFDDVMFCRQLCELLQNHHLGKSIKEIGDLEVDRFL